MMKDDEKALLLAVRTLCGVGSAVHVRDVRIDLDMHPKRAFSILEKWTRKGWYNYGVSLDLGWLEPAGVAEADRIAEGAAP